MTHAAGQFIIVATTVGTRTNDLIFHLSNLLFGITDFLRTLVFPVIIRRVLLVVCCWGRSVVVLDGWQPIEGCQLFVREWKHHYTTHYILSRDRESHGVGVIFLETSSTLKASKQHNIKNQNQNQSQQQFISKTIKTKTNVPPWHQTFVLRLLLHNKDQTTMAYIIRRTRRQPPVDYGCCCGLFVSQDATQQAGAQ